MEALLRPLNLAARLLCRSKTIRRAVRRATARRITILMYHGVTPDPLPVRNWCHMPVSEFAGQMDFVAANYTLLPLPDVVRRLASNQRLPDHTACVTFDDGFRNILTTALPVLKKHSIPFTVFVATSMPDSGAPPWPEQVLSALLRSARPSFPFEGETVPLQSAADRERAFHRTMRVMKSLAPADRQRRQEALVHALLGDEAPPASDPWFTTLSWADIDTLSASGLAEFGSHTHTHEILVHCSEDEQRVQLKRSREILAERRGRCDLLAYPNGDYSDSLKRMAKDLGYAAAVTTEHRLNRSGADLYALSRIGIGAGWSAEQFEIKILGN